MDSLEQAREGLLIILSSPSGAGKSTLSRRLMETDPDIRFSVSATTRPPRPGELDGQHYYFLSESEFMAEVEEGNMLEHALVFGNRYGSPKGPVKDALKAGQDILFDIDWQGGQQVRHSSMKESVVSIFILPPSIAALRSRLEARAQDSADTVDRRMAQSREEISHWAEYDYVLVNEDLDRCTEQLRAILTAERLKRNRQPSLVPFVNTLNVEFEEGCA